jgi:hypothetical protein
MKKEIHERHTGKRKREIGRRKERSKLFQNLRRLTLRESFPYRH